MARPCFRKKDSNPPVCGAHDVPLVEHQSSENVVASTFGEFGFLICPVSGQVVGEAETQS
jgi:hypothetical protein